MNNKIITTSDDNYLTLKYIEYDNSNQIISIEQYNLDNQLIFKQDELGNTEKFKYHSSSNIPSELLSEMSTGFNSIRKWDESFELFQYYDSDGKYEFKNYERFQIPHSDNITYDGFPRMVNLHGNYRWLKSVVHNDYIQINNFHNRAVFRMFTGKYLSKPNKTKNPLFFHGNKFDWIKWVYSDDGDVEKRIFSDGTIIEKNIPLVNDRHDDIQKYWEEHMKPYHSHEHICVHDIQILMESYMIKYGKH